MSETYKSAIKDDKKPLIKHGFISKGSIICVTRSDYIAQCKSIVSPPPPPPRFLSLEYLAFQLVLLYRSYYIVFYKLLMIFFRWNAFNA